MKPVQLNESSVIDAKDTPEMVSKRLETESLMVYALILAADLCVSRNDLTVVNGFT